MPPLTPPSLESNFSAPRNMFADDKKGSPQYLCIKRSIYYFRYALPSAYRKYLARSEVRISLRTSYLRVARFRARMLFAEIERAFLEGIMLDYKEIRRRMNILLQNILEQDHRNISERKGLSIQERDIDIPYAQLINSNADILAAVNNNEEVLKKLVADIIPHLLFDRVFLPGEITIENSLEVVKAYNQMQVTANRIIAARANGDFMMEEEVMNRDYGKLPYEAESGPVQDTSALTISEASVTKYETAFLYSEVMSRYITQKISDGDWGEHSLADHQGRLSEFLTIIGDKPIAKISRDDMRRFRETLRKLPPNRTRVKAFKGKRIQELLDMNIAKTLSITTVNIHVEAVGSMLEWCIREGMLETNPATRLQLKDKRQAVELRSAFTSEELSKIFSHPKFSQKKFKSLSYFWIPLIALYTGMRLEEIAQLHCSDVYESATKGIWVIDINDSGVDEQQRPKLLKNKNARRLVPVHPVLISMGFLDYNTDIARKNHVRLFPDLNKSEGALKFGKQPGKQFKSVVTATLGKVAGKTFHSLRHTFSDFYKQRGLQNDYFRQVFGHELPMLAANQYGAKFPPELLYEEVIVKLGYGTDIF